MWNVKEWLKSLCMHLRPKLGIGRTFNWRCRLAIIYIEDASNLCLCWGKQKSDLGKFPASEWTQPTGHREQNAMKNIIQPLKIPKMTREIKIHLIKCDAQSVSALWSSNGTVESQILREDKKKKALEVQSPDDCDSPKPSRISVNTAKNNLLTTRRREACCTNRFKTEVLWRTGLNKNILALVKTVKDPPLTFSKSRVPLKPPRNRKSSFWK